MFNGRKKIFITGGAGFIGSTLTGLFVENNDVVIYDNFKRDALSSKPFANHPNLKIVRGDILDAAALSEAMKGAQLVVHCAAIAGIDTVIKSPVTTMRVNMIGSANVLDCASKLDGLERVICFSTSEVFGSHAFRSSEAESSVIGTVGEGRWTYAVSKLAEEHLAISYFKEMGLPAVVLRPFNVYGPGQVGEGAMRIFIQKALADEPITIHGDGTQIRAWCYVDDMIAGTLLALERKEALGEAFNIGNIRAVQTIYGLANTVIRVLSSNSEIRFVPASSADIELRIPSVDKARNLLGFEARVDLELGIRETARFYRKALKWNAA